MGVRRPIQGESRYSNAETTEITHTSRHKTQRYINNLA
jgi:hypothetical protein